MAGEWRAHKIGDLFELKPGFAFKGADFKLSGAPVIKIKNVKTGSVVLDDLSYVDEGFLEAKKNFIVRHGDILITMSGNRFDGSRDTWVGKVAQFLSRRPCLLNQRVAVLKPRIGYDLDRRCCSYILGSREYQELFIAIATSSGGQANLSPGQILGADILLPPHREQRAIAHILGMLDDNIELNRRMNETLETMARALFKSWFVDFDPVRAKAKGRDPGLPKHLADLFPDSFENSELGEIPKGWEIRGLDQIARFINGLALQKYPPADGRSLPVIKIAQLRAGNANGADRASADLEPDYIVQDGEILFSWSGSLECVFWAGGWGALNQHLFKVKAADYPRWLCYLGVHQHLADFRHIAAGKATTMGHIQRHHLSDAKLAIPTPEVLSEMDRNFQPLLESTWQRAVQSRTLAILRDTLLPKLISGELRVKDAERFLKDRGL
jgi:type I restriction enzyme, S subunit